MAPGRKARTQNATFIFPPFQQHIPFHPRTFRIAKGGKRPKFVGAFVDLRELSGVERKRIEEWRTPKTIIGSTISNEIYFTATNYNY